MYKTEEFDTRSVQYTPDKHFGMINFQGFLPIASESMVAPDLCVTGLNRRGREVDALARFANPGVWHGSPALHFCGSPARLVGFTRSKSARELRQHHEALALQKSSFDLEGKVVSPEIRKSPYLPQKMRFPR